MREWTEGQRAAIMARNERTLVSAGAGSGKTAVLVERITRLVREGCGIDRMLVVTFTRAAAAEMRSRLTNELRRYSATEVTLERYGAYAYSQRTGLENVCTEALGKMENAQVCTLDAFCQRLVREFFPLVGVDPGVRPASKAAADELLEEATRCAINDMLGSGFRKSSHDWLKKLITAFGYDKVSDMVMYLYNFSMSLADPEEDLRRMAQDLRQNYNDSLWYGFVCDEAVRKIDRALVLCDETEHLFDLPACIETYMHVTEQDNHILNKIKGDYLLNGDREKMAAALRYPGFPKLPNAKSADDAQEDWKKKYQELRKKMKAAVAAAAGLINVDPQRIGDDTDNVYMSVTTLMDAAFLAKKYFDKAKNARNLLTFSDFKHLTIRILKSPEGDEIRSRFDQIFVDECQDLSLVDDTIIQLLHRENSCLFMVGDVKQSIYRFRLADPTLFLTRLRTYSMAPGGNERLILLSRNFRSKGVIIEGVNRIFRQIFRKNVTEMDYLMGDELLPGRMDGFGEKIQIRLLSKMDRNPDDDELKAVEEQADVIAQKIQNIIQMDCMEDDTTRKYMYRDIVILLSQTSGCGQQLSEELIRRGIPVFFDGTPNYYGLPEVTKVTSILRVLDNFQDDISLCAVMRNSPFNFTASELIEIRREQMEVTGEKKTSFNKIVSSIYLRDRDNAEKSGLSEKICRMIGQLDLWHLAVTSLPLHEAIWRIICESGIYMNCGILREGALRQSNLRILVYNAEQYAKESGDGGSLRGFLDYVSRETIHGDQKSATPIGENANVVRIMTMHKSKGLEFPVVFLPMLQQPIHKKSNSVLRTHRLLGAGLPVIHPESNVVRKSTPITAAFDVARTLDETAERARLLYVAMTRARDQLIMLGSIQDENPLWFQPESDDRVYSATSMLDWVMQSLPGYTGQMHWADDVFEVFHDRAFSAEPDKAETEKSRRVIHQLGEFLTVIKPLFPKEKTRVRQVVQPAITSVTGLVKSQFIPEISPDEPEETAITKSYPADLSKQVDIMDGLTSMPKDDTAPTAAIRGTATHGVLAKISLHAVQNLHGKVLREAILDEIDRMVHLGTLSHDEAKTVSVRQLMAFFESDLGQRMLSSTDVRREWRFVLKLSPSLPLVQGVIDCAFLEGDSYVILDYKTDANSSQSVLLSRYAPQLRLYAAALSKKHPVSQVWIFSLKSGMATEVDG